MAKASTKKKRMIGRSVKKSKPKRKLITSKKSTKTKKPTKKGITAKKVTKPALKVKKAKKAKNSKSKKITATAKAKANTRKPKLATKKTTTAVKKPAKKTVKKPVVPLFNEQPVMATFTSFAVSRPTKEVTMFPSERREIELSKNNPMESQKTDDMDDISDNDIAETAPFVLTSSDHQTHQDTDKTKNEQ